MTDNQELHGNILKFLMGEWARKENRQLMGVDLLYAPGHGYRDEEIRRWERADEPEFFAEFVNVEKLVATIVEIAETDADTRPAGKHRYVVRTRQHMGSKPSMSFALQPSYGGSGDEVSIVPTNGAGASREGNGRGIDVTIMQILSGNNNQAMRINAQMFDSALRPLAQQNQQLLAELIALRTENSELQKKLAEAEANKSDREFQIAMAMEKNNRANLGFQKLMQIGTVVASKIASGSSEQQAQLGEGNPLAMLLGEFQASLRPDQMQALMQILDMGQKIMFMEIANLVKVPDKPPPQQGAPNGAR